MAIKKKTSKKKTRRKVAGTAPKRKIPGWIILLSGVLFGLAIAVYAYVNDWVPKPDLNKNQPIAQTSQTQKKPKVEDKSLDLQIKPKKDYDFYETLQDMEVVVDAQELTQTSSDDSSQYVLQLGAFKTLSDAESLKAQVAFIGLTTIIQSVQIKKNQWHRVRLGPYDSGRTADVAKRNLEKNGFNAIILKEK